MSGPGRRRRAGRSQGQDRPQKYLASTLTRSEGMPMPESSRPSEPKADNAGMTSRPTLANPRTAPPSATAGSQATSRPATSNGRSPSCNSTTPTLKSSPTLHPDSTTAERDLLPYWNDYTKAISSRLWQGLFIFGKSPPSFRLQPESRL